MKYSYEKSVLENGLRVITLPIPAFSSVTLMAMVRGGSRYEEKEHNGISHFMEHMFFKGAEKYKTKMDVSSAIEGVGGDFNAFTGREEVAYYIKLASDKKEVAYDVLSDMLLKSTFDEREIEKERSVIIEEIRRKNDNPGQLIWSDFREHFYGDQPLGWRVLGPEEIIKTLTKQKFIDYRDKHYTPKNIVIAAVGDISHQTHLELVNNYFRFERNSERVGYLPFAKIKGERSFLRKKDIEQGHFVMGFQVPGEEHKDQSSLSVLSNILGETMSSRLSNEIREKRGLAYSIFSYCETFMDTGSFMVYGGINADKVDEAIKATIGEIEKIVQQGITEEELTRAKNNLNGTFVLSLENTFTIVELYAEQETLFGKIKTPEQIMKEISNTNIENVNEAAKKYLSRKNARLSVLGPYNSVDKLDQLLD